MILPQRIPGSADIQLPAQIESHGVQRQRLWWMIFVFLALVLVLAIGGGPIWKRLEARHDVRALSFGIEFYFQEQGQYPRGTPAEICRLLRGETVNGQNTSRLDYIEAKPREIDVAGEFIDPWGHPYRLQPGRVPSVYSLGPNGVDEHGGGDNIAP